MSYSGYSSDEYKSEVDAILSEKYAGKPRADYRIYSIYDSAYQEGVSPAVAARRVAFASRLRRKERYWLESGPKIESGYAYSKRVGSRKDWDTIVVTADKLNPRARFLGFRSIDGSTMAVWKVGQRLYAQTAVGPRHPSHFSRDPGRRKKAARIPRGERAATSREIRSMVREGYSPRYAARAAYHEHARDRLSTSKLKRIPSHMFALPERRSLPLVDAAHVRNAAARLAQMHRRGTVTEAEYRKAHARIRAAGRRLGVRIS